MNTISIRQSKFRHIVGKEEQQRNCYLSIRLGTPSPDSNFIDANRQFIALPWATKGGLCIIPHEKTGAVDREDLPLIMQDEDENVNDFAFHPFDDHLIASASQDSKAYLWRIPEGGLTENVTASERSFAGHRSRLMLIGWHPLATNVLVTVGADKDVKLWDAELGEEKVTLPKEHKELLASFTWNEDGSSIATFGRDKQLRIFDPRSPALSGAVQAHEGTKGGRVLWLKGEDRLVTTGFTRGSDREVKGWDLRSLSQPFVSQKLDTGSSVIVPFYDPDTKILSLAGKGDGLIRMYEVTDDAPYLAALSEYKSSKPTSGLVFLPKQTCNVMDCEINRVFKLTTTEVIPISFSIPRQNKMFFQDDLFPPTWDRQPTLSAADWFGGATVGPNKVSLEPPAQ